MNAEPDALLRHLDENINSVLARPRMWGSMEAVEAILITLLEVRFFHLHGDGNERLLDHYRRALARETGAGNAPLHVRVPDEEKFMQHLRDIVESLRAQM